MALRSAWWSAPWSSTFTRTYPTRMPNQRIFTAIVSAANSHGLQVMPASFVSRIQVGSVARQGLKPHVATGPSDKFLDRGPAMDRRAIPNHQQTLARHAQQVLQELDAVQAVQGSLPSQSVDLSRRRHPAYDRQMVARLLVVNDRRLPFRSVGSHDPRQEVEPSCARSGRHDSYGPQSC